MLTAIICATDLSHRSDRALERSVQLAEQRDLPLHVIHVIDPDIPETLWQAQKDQVRTEIREALGRIGIVRAKATVEILVGRPSTEVAIYAGALKGSLVVLGYPRVAEGGSPSFGSFSAGRILRSAVAPVLIVKDRGNNAYRRAAVGVDFSPFSARAAQLAAQLVPEGEVVLIHACHVPYKGFLRGEETRQEFEAGQRQKLEDFIDTTHGQRQGGLKFRCSRHVREGEVHHVLRAEVKKLGADLLVLGTHGRSGLSRALFGSVAEDMLASMLCDLLITVPNSGSE